MVFNSREKRNFKKANKLLFSFIFFAILFLLCSSDVLAAKNGTSSGTTNQQQNLNPTNDAMNALQKAGAKWIPTNSAQFLQYINPRQETLPSTFDDLTPEGQFIHYNLDGTASPDEASLAYNGYYDFRIQIRMNGETSGNSNLYGDYISRIYFKYIEISIEHRSVYKANPSIITVSGGPNVGLWMYLSSRVEVDQLEMQNIFPIEYLDIFNEELKGDTTRFA